MSIATSLYAIGDAIDPSLAFWSVLLRRSRKQFRGFSRAVRESSRQLPHL